MKSLKLKIMLPVLIIVLVGANIVSAIAYFQAKKVITNDVEQISKNKVDKLVTITDDKIYAWKGIINLLSGIGAVKNLDYQELNKFVSDNKENFKDFQLIIMSGKDGNYMSNQGKSGNISDRDYFPMVMKGETVVAEPVISKSTGVPIIVIAAPIKDDLGQVIGLIGGTIELSYITNIVNAEKLGETGYAYMINKKGTVIAHPNAEFVLMENLLNNKSETLVQITKNMMRGKADVENYMFESTEKIAAYAPMKTTGWSIAMTTEYSEVTKGVLKLRNIIIMLSILTVLLIGVILYYIVSKTIKPILKMADITKEVAGGDLTAKVDVRSNDEIGILAKNFNSMIDNMRELLSEMKRIGLTVVSTSEEVKASTEEASKVSEQVALTISELAKGATEQSQSTVEGSNMVNDLIVEINRILDNINESKNLTFNAKETVDEGVKILEFQKDKMLENKQATINVSNEIILLSDKSGQIGQIVELISSIAEQTNLLALNAAIEAARAGEQGRGFAVVAEEVRKLAEESSRATQNISGLIKEIQTSVNSVVGEVKKAEDIVIEQESAVKQTTGTFNDILKSVEKVTENIIEVANACVSVNGHSKIVNENINNIASITQENAAATEEVAASTEEQTAALEQIAASAEQLFDISNKQQKFIDKFNV